MRYNRPSLDHGACFRLDRLGGFKESTFAYSSKAIE